MNYFLYLIILFINFCCPETNAASKHTESVKPGIQSLPVELHNKVKENFIMRDAQGRVIRDKNGSPIASLKRSLIYNDAVGLKDTAEERDRLEGMPVERIWISLIGNIYGQGAALGEICRAHPCTESKAFNPAQIEAFKNYVFEHLRRYDPNNTVLELGLDIWTPPDNIRTQNLSYFVQEMIDQLGKMLETDAERFPLIRSILIYNRSDGDHYNIKIPESFFELPALREITLYKITSDDQSLIRLMNCRDKRGPLRIQTLVREGMLQRLGKIAQRRNRLCIADVPYGAYLPDMLQLSCPPPWNTPPYMLHMPSQTGIITGKIKL